MLSRRFHICNLCLQDLNVTVFENHRATRVHLTDPPGTIARRPKRQFLRLRNERERQRNESLADTATYNSLQAGRDSERASMKPFGLTFDCADESKRSVPNDAAQGTIDRMRQLRTSGYSLRGIARELTKSGIPTKEGRAWSAAAIHRILDARRLQVA
jgi:Recombinase